MVTRLEGRAGWARLTEGYDDPQGLVVAQWYMHLPDQTLGSHHFMLGVVSLAEAPGARPPKKQYPQAAYELLVASLAPEPAPDPADPHTWRTLEPVNVVEQFHGVSWTQAAQVAACAVRACVQRRLPAETQLFVQLADGTQKMMFVKELLDMWHSSIGATVAHIACGEHDQ